MLQGTHRSAFYASCGKKQNCVFIKMQTTTTTTRHAPTTCWISFRRCNRSPDPSVCAESDLLAVKGGLHSASAQISISSHVEPNLAHTHTHTHTHTHQLAPIFTKSHISHAFFLPSRQRIPVPAKSHLNSRYVSAIFCTAISAAVRAERKSPHSGKSNEIAPKKDCA